MSKKTILAENNFFKVVEKKKSKKVIMDITVKENEDMGAGFEDFNIETEDSGKVIITVYGVVVAEFGYSKRDIEMLNLDWEKRKITKKNNKFVISIPFKRNKKVSKEELIEAFEAVLDFYDGEEFSTVEKEGFDKLEKVYHKVRKYGVAV